jgi:putative transposase
VGGYKLNCVNGHRIAQTDGNRPDRHEADRHASKRLQEPDDIVGKNGLLKQLTKALLERGMSAELTEHVGYEKHDPAGNNSGNSRNGSSKKKLKGEFGEFELGHRATAMAVSNRRSSSRTNAFSGL